MTVVPTVRCSNLARSVEFYTRIADFALAEPVDDFSDPGFAALVRGSSHLFLSSHRGDGEFGQAVAIFTPDVDRIFHELRARGLKTPGNPDAPQMVHEAPSTRPGARASSTSTIPTATRSGTRRSSPLARARSTSC
jgi:hypothetical protein